MLGTHNCNCCGSPVEPLLRLGAHPIVNQLTESAQSTALKYPMNVAGCTYCGLVQLSPPIDASLFYTDYATPSAWKREPHIASLIEALRPILPRESRVLDIGCNDGKFLQHLLADGWRNVTGLEPTRNTAEAAISQGLTVVGESLNPAVAEQLVVERGPWDCISLRQVLEHIVDLDGFGRSFNRLLVDNGLLVIEIPDSRVNLSGRDYALWEEHVNHFTPETLGAFLTGHGFEVFKSYESQFSGVCLTALARKVAEPGGETAKDCVLSPDILAVQVGAFRTWAESFDEFKSRVREEIAEHASHGEVILYGVGSRSSNFINIMDLAQFVTFAVDDQPQKQDKFMPGSGIPILSRDEAEMILSSSAFVLLGVNGENEESLLASSTLLRGRSFASVLPPSAYLLKAWDSV